MNGGEDVKFECTRCGDTFDHDPALRLRMHHDEPHLMDLYVAAELCADCAYRFMTEFAAGDTRNLPDAPGDLWGEGR